jgi:drug/metabolite transporter (DMT)-like permease
MTGATVAISLGTIAAFCYGTGDFFGARSSKHIGPVTAAFCVHVIGVVLISLWYFTFVHTIPKVSSDALGSILIGAILVAIGAVLLYKAFEVGPVSLASTLGAAYPLVTAAIGIALFNAKLSGGQLIGVLLLVSGIMAASGLINTKRGDYKFGKGPILGLLTSLAWGTGFPFLDHAVSITSWQTVIFLQVLISLPVIGIFLWLAAKREKTTRALLIKTLKDPFIISTGAAIICADFIINYGFVFDPAGGTLVIATSACYPVITALLAFRHFKERIEPVPLFGAFVTITGVVFLLI